MIAPNNVEIVLDNVRIVDYEEIHAKLIQVNPGEHEGIRDHDTSRFVGNDLSYTILSDDSEILAIFGVQTQERLAKSWLVLSSHFGEYAMEVTAAINHMIESLAMRGTHNRLFGSAPVDSPVGQRWISKHLGFTKLDHIIDEDGVTSFLYERSL